LARFDLHHSVFWEFAGKALKQYHLLQRSGHRGWRASCYDQNSALHGRCNLLASHLARHGTS
jgi:hypothetical protein